MTQFQLQLQFYASFYVSVSVSVLCFILRLSFSCSCSFMLHFTSQFQFQLQFYASFYVSVSVAVAVLCFILRLSFSSYFFAFRFFLFSRFHFLPFCIVPFLFFVNGFIIFPLMDISISVNGNHTGRESSGVQVLARSRSRNLPATGPSYSFSYYYNNNYYCSCYYYYYHFNSIVSGVSEPQVAENCYLPLIGGIAFTTVYALTCYTLITIPSTCFLLH